MFFDKVTRHFSDSRGLWRYVVPLMRKSVEREFTKSNLNNWKPLTQQYRRLKLRKGYPDIIGVASGELKNAATYKAVVTQTKKKLIYSVFRKYKYFEYFAARRPLFIYTKETFNVIYAQAFQEWLKTL